MGRVIITSDSTADINHLYKERNIPMLPLIVNLGTESYLDGVTIFPDDIYKYVAEHKELPKTSACSEDAYRNFFKQFTDQGCEVVHFSLSSKLSANFQEAAKAAAGLDGVYVIDSQSLSTGVGLCVLYGCDLRDEGKGAKEIYELAQARVGAVQASFVLSTVEYLHKGGRCSGLSALMASVLAIKPTILVEKGGMRPGKKYFASSLEKAVSRYIYDTLEAFSTPDRKRVFITHSTVPAEVLAHVKETLEASGKFDEIIVTVAGSTITSHCGKGTLGILYFNDGQA